jgi:beta-phosphoglucomutase-like phosphatase (HAD superfamily)
MQTIKGILFEPVGCLAEFPPEPFLEIAARLSGRKKQSSKSGSRAYWHLLNLMQEPCSTEPRSTEPRASASGLLSLEVQAVEGASLYEDVLPALSELKAMGIQLFITSSLSSVAIASFLDRSRLHEYFSSVWSRDNAQGIKAAPLQSALAEACLEARQAMFLTDAAQGLKVAESVGVNPILMMNDPDESRRLAMHNPAGGIVSLHELPDFIRLVRAENVRPRHPLPADLI